MMRYRHIKRQTVYTLLSAELFLHELSWDNSTHSLGERSAMLQCSTAKAENSRYGGPVCLYESETGELYLRPPFEFFDPTRFERLEDE